MNAYDDYFAPVDQRINRTLFHAKSVVIVGMGTVGSHIAEALAKNAVGHLLLIDGDRLEVRNLHRHVLKASHLGWYKTLGMAAVLKTIPGLRVETRTTYITPSMPNSEVDALLSDADVIIAATDRRDVQRRIGQRARVLDIPALFPGIYAGDGCEVFVQRSWTSPCYTCWDGWRREQEQLREAGVRIDDTLALVSLTAPLVRGILDPDNDDASLLDRPQGMAGMPQLYVQNRFALAIKPVERREDCPSCGGARPATPPTGARPSRARTTAPAESAPIFHPIGFVEPSVPSQGDTTGNVVSAVVDTVASGIVALVVFFVLFFLGLGAVYVVGWLLMHILALLLGHPR